MALDSTALIQDVDKIAEYLKETPPIQGDARPVVEAIINGLSAAIEAFCNRKFLAHTVSAELYSGDGGPAIMLRSFPVNSITTVLELDTSDGTTKATVDGSDYYVDEMGYLWKYGVGCWNIGRDNYKITYVAGGTAVPADLYYAMLNLSARAYRDWDKKRDDIESISLDGHTTIFNVEEFPPKIRGIIKRHRVPR